MTAILDYGLDSVARSLLVMVLSLKDNAGKKEMDKLHIQKTIKYFGHMQQEEIVDFSNYLYGGVSYELQENLETLEESGLIDRVGSPKRPRFQLTEEGEKVAEELLRKYSQESIRRLRFSKQQINDLTYEETLYFMYRLIPETQKNSIEFERLDQKKRLLVLKLLHKGRINSDTAAEWLGVEKKTFLESLTKSD